MLHWLRTIFHKSAPVPHPAEQHRQAESTDMERIRVQLVRFRDEVREFNALTASLDPSAHK